MTRVWSTVLLPGQTSSPSSFPNPLPRMLSSISSMRSSASATQVQLISISKCNPGCVSVPHNNRPQACMLHTRFLHFIKPHVYGFMTLLQLTTLKDCCRKCALWMINTNIFIISAETPSTAVFKAPILKSKCSVTDRCKNRCIFR